VAVLEVDHFERINDRYWHAAGDAALRRTPRAAKPMRKTSAGSSRSEDVPFTVSVDVAALGADTAMADALLAAADAALYRAKREGRVLLRVSP
jgi:GGDEF domain-containing protein